MTTATTTVPGATGHAHLTTIGCAYCRSDVIPVRSFEYLSESGRLLSAVCPGCDRRVTLTKDIWMSWGGSTDARPRA